jgi:hypothetical protein
MGFRKKAFVWTTILALLLPGQAGAASNAGDLKILTTGVRSLADEDTSTAREKAVSAALTQAVAQAYARTVSPRVFAANLEFLHTRILPAAEDFIVTYRVLAEVTRQDTVLVGVESRVHTGMLEQVLAEAGILEPDADRPGILLLIAEQTSREPLVRYWWGNHPEPYFSHAEIRITDKLLEKRFHVLGTGPERPDPRAYGIRFQSIYDPAAAVDLAKEMGADLVVLGRAGASESINRMGGEKIFDGVIHLEVLDAATGESVASVDHQAAAKADTDQPGDIRAIDLAAGAAAEDLTVRLDAVWAQKQRKETTFDVRIEGNGFLPRFIALKKRFAEIREIENVQPREIGSDQAVMEMVYKGSPERFAQRIMLTTFDGFGIEIVELTDTLVGIRFIDGVNTYETGTSTVPESDSEKTHE